MADTEHYYTIDEIEHFLLTEHPALHGTSPLVFEQNKAVASLIAKAAESFGPDILGIQLLGSRAHGSAGLKSDFDTTILTYEGRYSVAADLRAMVRHVLLSTAGIEIDTGIAGVVQGIRSEIPLNPHNFAWWAANMPQSTAGLYESSVYDSKNLRLCALAAAEAIAATPDPQEVWSAVRAKHADVYLGRAERLHDKLADRLPYSREEIADRFDDEFMEERIRRLGLPEEFEEHYSILQDWMSGQVLNAGDTAGIQLYEQVTALVRK